ncbi:hypothetical protein KOSB73_220118 [Klebsiella grimontii]|uniref:Uncharacterized protein n=1 Tax=Klebsiella grimontii TaxID=2058152 RepID=A0A285AZ60_9ENTR|nr:hypothetical protein KOSB73_220118 [Klebsiella grimontii]
MSFGLNILKREFADLDFAGLGYQQCCDTFKISRTMGFNFIWIINILWISASGQRMTVIFLKDSLS